MLVVRPVELAGQTCCSRSTAAPSVPRNVVSGSAMLAGVGGIDGIEDLAALDREQRRLAAAEPGRVPQRPLVVGGVFVAFARGQQGPGHAGDNAVVGAAATRDTTELARLAFSGRAPAPYSPGYLAAREGAMLETAVAALSERGVKPDVLLVDAPGRDHPRRCGLALHLGVVLVLPTVGVTHRPLRASGPEPSDEPGAWTDLRLGDDVVGRWVRTRRGARPLAVHAAWHTDPSTATEVVLRVTVAARTPEPPA